MLYRRQNTIPPPDTNIRNITSYKVLTEIKLFWTYGQKGGVL